MSTEEETVLTTEGKYTAKDDFSVILEREILQCISQDLRNLLRKTGHKILATVEEIRIRASRPVILQNYNGDWFLYKDGTLSDNCCGDVYIAMQEEIQKTLELMSENSIYAYQDEIKNGFITIKGGHRVGIAGKTVLDTNSVKNIRDVSSLNIRISREIPGCSSGVARHLVYGGKGVRNTLIVSPPQCGKTTMLRDIARFLGDGMASIKFRGVKVGIIDERAELAACFRGVPQNRVGIRTDVLDGCPKQIGIMMLLRSMSPEVIITDEIGNRGDFESIMKAVNSGVKVITSVHGHSLSDIRKRQDISELMQSRVFERYVILSCANGPGTVEEIIDGETLHTLEKRREAPCS